MGQIENDETRSLIEEQFSKSSRWEDSAKFYADFHMKPDEQLKTMIEGFVESEG